MNTQTKQSEALWHIKEPPKKGFGREELLQLDQEKRAKARREAVGRFLKKLMRILGLK